LYFRHLNLHQLYPHILKPNYMPNTALLMQLSEVPFLPVKPEPCILSVQISFLSGMKNQKIKTPTIVMREPVKKTPCWFS
jgi:hypothetical protein